MTATYSRLANLREKRTYPYENSQSEQDLKLILNDAQKINYDPTITFNKSKQATRLLKGRIDKSSENQKKLDGIPNNNPNEGYKLVLNDPIQFQVKKTQTMNQVPSNKRINITRQTIRQEQKKQQPITQKIEQIPITKEVVTNVAIQQQEAQQSKGIDINQNQLILCQQGCGRKFNRKALEKHSKACKIVFMSKRKQFNSETKRLVSKQQATLIKQNKQKQKTSILKKNQQKTNQNWKIASQDFRTTLKAIVIKDQDKQKIQNTITCLYCQKIFKQVFMEKHLENCLKKKQKQKKNKKKIIKNQQI